MPWPALSYALKGLFSLLFYQSPSGFIWRIKPFIPMGLNHDNAEFSQPEDKAIKNKKSTPDQVIEVDVVDKKDHSA
jgi:hypothetical protein